MPGLPERPLRLLHYTAGYAPAWSLGGPPRSTANLCEGLAARGHHVTVFATKLGLAHRRELPDGDPVQRGGVTVHYFPLSGAPGIRSSAMAEAVRARVGEFDLVHVTGVWQATSPAACRAAERAGVPYIVSPRGALSRYSFSQKPIKKASYWWLYERTNVNRAAAVHYTARVEAEECARLHPRPPGFVVPNSIDLAAWRCDRAAAAAWRERHSLSFHEFVFLASGRLHHKKGLELLVSAAADLPRDLPWSLVFAGPDEDGTGARLRQLGEVAGLADRLRFTGALDTPELVAAYSAAGLLLFPSRNENFGNVAVEALACGLPVALAPEVGCARELAELPGVFVLARETEVWRRQMRAALSGTPLAAEVAAGRRRELERRYSPEAVAAAMEAAYRDVLAGRLSARLAAA